LSTFERGYAKCLQRGAHTIGVAGQLKLRASVDQDRLGAVWPTSLECLDSESHQSSRAPPAIVLGQHRQGVACSPERLSSITLPECRKRPEGQRGTKPRAIVGRQPCPLRQLQWRLEPLECRRRITIFSEQDRDRIRKTDRWVIWQE